MLHRCALIRGNLTDLWLMIGFGIIGYGAERLRFPLRPWSSAPFSVRLPRKPFMKIMISFGNDWTIFFTRPISGP